MVSGAVAHPTANPEPCVKPYAGIYVGNAGYPAFLLRRRPRGSSMWFSDDQGVILGEVKQVETLYR